MKIGTSLRLALDVWTWRHGALWWCCGAALLTAAALEFAVTRPSRGRADAAIQARAALAATPSASAPHPAPDVAGSPDQRLSEVRAMLRAAPREESLLRAWSDMARTHDVRWSQADFTIQTDPLNGVRRARMSMPLKGTYPRMRAFAEDALRTSPNVSLDQIDFQRRTSLATEPDARFVFTFWSLEGSDVPTAPHAAPPPPGARP